MHSIFALSAVFGAALRCRYSSSFSTTSASSSHEFPIAFCNDQTQHQRERSYVIDPETVKSGATWGQSWVSDWDGHHTGAHRDVRRQLILIRHGQYENEKSGSPDEIRRLTPLGQEQARETGRFLRRVMQAREGEESELFYAPRVTSVTSSNLRRAIETAQLIAEEMESGRHREFVHQDPDLAERLVCDPSPELAGKRARPEDHETVERAFKRYVHRPPAGQEHSSMHLLVCHGNVIRYFICRALQLPPEAWLRMTMPHASITSISVRGSGSVSINMAGAASHLPQKMQTIHNVK